MKSYIKIKSIHYLDKKILFSVFCILVFSCKKTDVNISLPLNSFIEISKDYYQENLANSSIYSFNSENLIIDWGSCESVKLSDNQNDEKSLTSDPINTKVTELPEPLPYDKWGNVELFCTPKPDCSQVKMPVKIKLKNGKTLDDNRFFYVNQGKKGDCSFLMVQFGKNKSNKQGYYTGKVVLVCPKGSVSNTICFDYIENQIVHTSLFNGSYKDNSLKSANNLLGDFPDEDIIGYFECPQPLVYDSSTEDCELDNGQGGCPGFYVSINGETKSACSTNPGDKVTFGKVMDCLQRVVFGMTISNYIIIGADSIPVSTLLSVLSRCAVRVICVAAAAIFIADFGDCMGFYNIW